MRKRERGTGGLFKKRGSKYWYAQFYDANGKKHRISTKKAAKEEAQGVLRNLLTDKDRGVPFVGDLKKLTYGALRGALIANYVEKGNRSLLTTAGGSDTINGLQALDEFFGYKEPDEMGVSVTRMTTDSARKFVEKRQAEGMSNSTINSSLASLRRMLVIAHEDGKLQNVPKIRLLKPNPPRKGFLPRDKFEELLGHLPANLKPLVTFLYYCGVRVGEALQIDWAQVNLGAGVIRLEDDQTKTGEARSIPLPDVLLGMLEQKTGPVFDATNLRKAWQKACVAAKLGTLAEADKAGNRKYEGLIIHDLRRSAIKNLMKSGVNEKVAMAISGHKTRAVFDRYHIVDETDVLDAMRKVQNGSSLVQVPSGRRQLGR
jgi:integrase